MQAHDGYSSSAAFAAEFGDRAGLTAHATFVASVASRFTDRDVCTHALSEQEQPCCASDSPINFVWRVLADRMREYSPRATVTPGARACLRLVPARSAYTSTLVCAQLPKFISSANEQLTRQNATLLYINQLLAELEASSSFTAAEWILRHAL